MSDNKVKKTILDKGLFEYAKILEEAVKPVLFPERILPNGTKSKKILASEVQSMSYSFLSLIINYYSRVRTYYKIDYDSFMIVAVVLSHGLYEVNKTPSDSEIERIEEVWDLAKPMIDSEDYFSSRGKKLGSTSIAHVLNLPEETCRRKILELVKKKMLLNKKTEGIRIHPDLPLRHKEFQKETVNQVAKMLRNFEDNNLIKGISPELDKLSKYE